jgi:hypothetical protein
MEENLKLIDTTKDSQVLMGINEKKMTHLNIGKEYLLGKGA